MKIIISDENPAVFKIAVVDNQGREIFSGEAKLMAGLLLAVADLVRQHLTIN